MVTWLRHLLLNVVKMENEEWWKVKGDNLMLNGLLKYCTCNFTVPSFAKLSIIFFSNFHLLSSKNLLHFLPFPKFPKFLSHTLFYCLCTTMEVKNDGTVNMIWVKLTMFPRPPWLILNFEQITLFTSLRNLIS